MAFVGGLESYRFDLLADVCHLALDEKQVREGARGSFADGSWTHSDTTEGPSCVWPRQSITSNFVKRFRSLRTLLSFADDTEDTEWSNRASRHSSMTPSPGLAAHSYACC